MWQKRSHISSWLSGTEQQNKGMAMHSPKAAWGRFSLIRTEKSQQLTKADCSQASHVTDSTYTARTSNE